MLTGILAVQGAFREHAECLERLSADYVYIRNKSDISDKIDRLILPGGESTVQRKLISELGMFDYIKDSISNGMPVLGTCAGLILLAQNIVNGEDKFFGTLPVSANDVNVSAICQTLGGGGHIKAAGCLVKGTLEEVKAAVVEAVRKGMEE